NVPPCTGAAEDWSPVVDGVDLPQAARSDPANTIAASADAPRLVSIMVSSLYFGWLARHYPGVDRVGEQTSPVAHDHLAGGVAGEGGGEGDDGARDVLGPGDAAHRNVAPGQFRLLLLGTAPVDSGRGHPRGYHDVGADVARTEFD